MHGMRKGSVVAFAVTVHVQTVVGPEYLATIANAMYSMGCEPRSISDLVAIALEMLAEVLVENGHTACVEPQVVEEVLSSIRHGRRRRPKLELSSTRLRKKEEKGDTLDAVVIAEARALHASGKYRQALHARSAMEPDSSVADDGEFSVRALREENEK